MLWRQREIVSRMRDSKCGDVREWYAMLWRQIHNVVTSESDLHAVRSEKSVMLWRQGRLHLCQWVMDVWSCQNALGVVRGRLHWGWTKFDFYTELSTHTFSFLSNYYLTLRSAEHVNTEAREHWSKWTLKHVNTEVRAHWSTWTLKHVHTEVRAHWSTCILKHVHTKARAHWSTWTLKHVNTEAREHWSTCTLKHVYTEAREHWSTWTLKHVNTEAREH